MAHIDLQDDGLVWKWCMRAYRYTNLLTSCSTSGPDDFINQWMECSTLFSEPDHVDKFQPRSVLNLACPTIRVLLRLW